MFAGRRLLVTLGLGAAVALGADASLGAPPPRKSDAGSVKTKVAAKGSKPKPAKAAGTKAKLAKAKATSRRSKTAARGSAGAKRARSKGKRRPEPEAERGHPRAPVLAVLATPIACPPDMVAVAGRVCVDRYETSLIDDGTGAPWSPFYAPDLVRARQTFDFYAALAGRTPRPVELELPAPPSSPIRARAVSIGGALPQGYMSADQADAACRVAGKRLCTESEWVTACMGEDQREFPYGDRYEQGACNVFRETHPSAELHGNASRYHDDPRNHLVEAGGRPLLDRTGASGRCASAWGDDAVMDMVGNLDEWVADAHGVFAGGFYSRGSRSGCYARVSTHVRAYSDYSTGARCCADPPTM